GRATRNGRRSFAGSDRRAESRRRVGSTSLVWVAEALVRLRQLDLLRIRIDDLVVLVGDAPRHGGVRFSRGTELGVDERHWAVVVEIDLRNGAQAVLEVAEGLRSPFDDLGEPLRRIGDLREDDVALAVVTGEDDQ